MEVYVQLSQLLTNESLVSTIYGERYLNDTKGSFADYSEVNPVFDPQGRLAHVVLPYTLLSSTECTVHKSTPSLELETWAVEKGKYKFFWHPDVDRHGLKVEGSVLTQPASSTRTLLTEDPPRLYIKTDLDKKHFRFIRRLQRSSVEHSLAICSDLREFCDAGLNPKRYAFLPESLGVVIQGGDYEGSGVIYREIVPYPVKKGRRVLMPYHSLYAHDPNAHQDEPLVVQIVKMHGGQYPVEYFVKHITGPLLESWVTLVSKRGLLPELHGQNTLIEIDKNLKPRRVIHRDFQGTYSDSKIRQKLNLPLFTKHVAGEEPGTTVQSQYSHVFDRMIGQYLLLRLTRAFCLYFPFDYGFVANAIKEYHHGLPGWVEADFPSTSYRFATTAQQQVGNDVSFVDTGILPEFR